MDKVWSDKTWENSALAEYERIASACEGGDSSQRSVLYFTYKQGPGKTWDEKADIRHVDQSGAEVVLALLRPFAPSHFP